MTRLKIGVAIGPVAWVLAAYYLLGLPDGRDRERPPVCRPDSGLVSASFFLKSPVASLFLPLGLLLFSLLVCTPLETGALPPLWRRIPVILTRQAALDAFFEQS